MPSIKIWLDDKRPKPNKYWRHCYTVQEVIDQLNFYHAYHPNRTIFISFDHDLGTDDTGYDLAKYIEMRASQAIKPPKYEIHSQNPVGRANIQAAMKSANRIYESLKKIHIER